MSKVELNTTPAPAQVAQEAPKAPSEVKVHELSVTPDRVITDLTDPLAVQVPVKDGSTALSSLAESYVSAKLPEEVFAASEPVTESTSQD
jgi:hypothetical protein